MSSPICAMFIMSHSTLFTKQSAVLMGVDSKQPICKIINLRLCETALKTHLKAVFTVVKIKIEMAGILGKPTTVTGEKCGSGFSTP